MLPEDVKAAVMLSSTRPPLLLLLFFPDHASLKLTSFEAGSSRLRLPLNRGLTLLFATANARLKRVRSGLLLLLLLVLLLLLLSRPLSSTSSTGWSPAVEVDGLWRTTEGMSRWWWWWWMLLALFGGPPWLGSPADPDRGGGETMPAVRGVGFDGGMVGEVGTVMGG